MSFICLTFQFSPTLCVYVCHAGWSAKQGKKTSHGDSKSFEIKVFAYKPRSEVSIDHGFSKAKRIVHDTKQSLRLAEALDAEFGRSESSDNISYLLREQSVS